MQTYAASVDGVIRMILIVLLLYFAVRFLGKLFNPPPKQNSGGPRSSSAPHNRPEGDVRIEYTDKSRGKQKTKDSKEGDYIDFEELDKP